MPKDAHVTFLGDGEFDGIDLQADLRKTDWFYVCRTASTIVVRACGVQFHVANLGPARGELLAVTPAWMTAEEYGPVSILALWEQQFKSTHCLCHVRCFPRSPLSLELFPASPCIGSGLPCPGG